MPSDKRVYDVWDRAGWDTAATRGCWSDRVIGFGIALQMRHYSGLERIYPALGKRKQAQEAAA